MKNVKTLLLLFIFFLPLNMNAQTVTVSGVVQSATDLEILIGVNVIEEKSQTGTTTDSDGKFELEFQQSELPVNLQFSYTGFEDQYISITKSELNLRVKMKTSETLLNIVEVRGQRIDQKQKESALTVESLSQIDIEQTASVNFFDGLGALKGVDLTTASMGVKIINMRGFNSTSPVRMLQIVNGIDNASPSLNFALGNFGGSSETDLQGIELVVGASSAFYGPNAFNGVVKMITKDPFYTKGLSAFIRGGDQQIREGDIRWADAIKNKKGKDFFAYKLNIAYFIADDWPADNYASISDGEADESNFAGYDAVNIYGDEYSRGNDLRNAGAPWQIPGLTLYYRNGYKESDLLDYNTENLKTGAAFIFRIRPDMESESPQISITGNFTQGSTIFQGATRFRIEDAQYMNAKVEFSKRNKFFLRAYVAKDDAGTTYNPFVTALKLQERQGSNSEWSSAYRSQWLGDYAQRAKQLGYPVLEIINGVPFFDTLAVNAFYEDPVILDSLSKWHNATVQLLNAAGSVSAHPFLAPGTPEFDAAFQEITTRLSNNTDFDAGGSRLFTNSELYHIAGEYIFQPSFLDKITVGATGRIYTPDTKGTIFNDLVDKITNREFGFYAGIEEKFFNEKFSLAITGRVDKNENFDWIGTPAASIVYHPTENNYLRLSFSSAIRNPTLIDQYQNLDVGPALFAGNLNGFDSLVTTESFLDYAKANLDRDKLVYFDVAPIQPEKVKNLEIGYRSIFGENLYIDASYFYNIYDQFIGFLVGLDVEFVGTVNIPTNVDAFRVTANSEKKVTSHGAAIGVNYYFKNYFQAGGNYTWNKLITLVDDDIIPAFNTPLHKFNLSLSGRDIPIRLGDFRSDGLGFNTNFKWVGSFVFEGSPQFTGEIEAYGLLDAQVNYNFRKINTTLKIGAANILDNQHYETIGGPQVGRIAYIRITYQFDKK